MPLLSRCMSMHFTTKAVVIIEATVFLQYPRLQSNIKSKKTKMMITYVSECTLPSILKIS